MCALLILLRDKYVPINLEFYYITKFYPKNANKFVALKLETNLWAPICMRCKKPNFDLSTKKQNLHYANICCAKIGCKNCVVRKLRSANNCCAKFSLCSNCVVRIIVALKFHCLKIGLCENCVAQKMCCTTIPWCKN